MKRLSIYIYSISSILLIVLASTFFILATMADDELRSAHCVIGMLSSLLVFCMYATIAIATHEEPNQADRLVTALDQLTIVIISEKPFLVYGEDFDWRNLSKANADRFHSGGVDHIFHLGYYLPMIPKDSYRMKTEKK